jgi:hypothetical protein
MIVEESGAYAAPMSAAFDEPMGMLSRNFVYKSSKSAASGTTRARTFFISESSRLTSQVSLSGLCVGCARL